MPNSLEKCELCREGGYWEKATETCYEYLEETKVENCYEYSGLVAGFCDVCKSKDKVPLMPATDFKSCIPIPPLVVPAGPQIILAQDPADYADCNLIGREQTDGDVLKCYTCQEGFYKIDGKCTGQATGDFMGCLEGDATICHSCNVVDGYVMRTPSGKCEKHAGILSGLVILITMLVFKF